MEALGTRSTTPFGGVSTERHKPALKRFVQSPDDLTPTAKAVGAHPRFKNHGGPVVAFGVVHASFWGSAWKTDPAHVQRAARLGQFLQNFLASSYMNILSQYGSGQGGHSKYCLGPSWRGVGGQKSSQALQIDFGP